MRSDAEPFDLQSILRPAVIVPESKRLDRMLKEFRSERFHMAIVVDEFGAVSGILMMSLMKKRKSRFANFLATLTPY